MLIDTSVLAPEPLWLWILALTDGIRATERPQLFVTQSIGWELRPALRRVDPRLTRAQAGIAARLRIDSLTRAPSDTPAVDTPAAGTPAAGTPAAGTPAAGTPAAGTPAAGTLAAGTSAHGAAPGVPTGADHAYAPRPHPSTDTPRPHVLDPDDAHLDAAALALDVDVLVTDDVHAFAPIAVAARGYALLSADEFLCALTDTFTLSIPEAADRYRSLLAWAAGEVGVAPLAGSPSHRLRRSRARRFAKRVVRGLRDVRSH